MCFFSEELSAELDLVEETKLALVCLYNKKNHVLTQNLSASPPMIHSVYVSLVSYAVSKQPRFIVCICFFLKNYQQSLKFVEETKLIITIMH
jgi:hypothetical protein